MDFRSQPRAVPGRLLLVPGRESEQVVDLPREGLEGALPGSTLSDPQPPSLLGDRRFWDADLTATCEETLCEVSSILFSQISKSKCKISIDVRTELRDSQYGRAYLCEK